MTTSAVGYVSLQGLGTRENCVAAICAVGEIVAGFNRDAGSCIANFSGTLLLDADMSEEEGIDPEVLHRVTNGTYPVALMNVTYDPDRLPVNSLNVLERKFDLWVTGRSSSTKLSLLEIDGYSG